MRNCGMSKHSIVIDFAGIAKLARGDADTASRRRRQVKLINAVFDGILQAIELEPYTKEQFTVWADSMIGEGLLFKSITNDIPSMVNFSIDSESDLATLESELSSLVDRYRPSTVVVPLSWPELESAQPAKRRRIRAMAARVLEMCKHLQLDTAWDTGFKPVDTPDTAVDTIKMMAWLQDRGLDPSSWVLDTPISEPRLMMMIGRAHIDGVSDIKLLFRTDDNSIDEGIDRARRVDSMANSAGIGQVYVGAPHVNAPLTQFMDGELKANEASAQVAEMLAEIIRKYNSELAPT